jgi:D-lactate dehydrogenase
VPAPDPGLVRDLGALLEPARVLARPIDLLARSVDASIYRLIPRAVVRPRDLDEVRKLLEYCRAHGRHLTFRAAGTSLSGQAVTDDILVELGPFWKGVRILDEGRRVWSQPGVVGGYVNRLLARHGYRLGPDPASIDACMLGGIVANNASGMCCGVSQNAYHTLESMTVLLADGTVVDTARPDADARLRAARPDLHAALTALRDEVRADALLSEKVRRKFARKNTTAYSLNALLDFDEPSQILAHLMVGSEGTLGFWAEATLRTIPEPPARATALVYFADLAEAGRAVAPLSAAGAVALEIMDAASLRSQATDREYPFAIGDRTAALLVEMRAADAEALATGLAAAERALDGLGLLAPVAFTTDPAERDRHWRLRKGLFPSVGGLRPSGTAVVIEDVVVPVERLAEGITDLQALFAEHGFDEAIVFGHARDGNLHFVFARDFADPPTVARYDAFMKALVGLIVGKYDGALKAEHGSGRNIAPFVRDEWGERAYDVMRRLKRLLDPDGILSPGVLLTDDPDAHIKHLKPLPTISPTADKCIECGFCEPRCPSRDITLSPRQRIVVVRELARLGAAPGAEAAEWRESLRRDYDYEGIATCARDSMCQTSCPVHIDTGLLIKEVKAASLPALPRRVARTLARHYGAVVTSVRAGLRVAGLVRGLPGGRALVEGTTAVLRRMSPDYLPRVPRDMDLPRAAPSLPRPPAPRHGRRVVYFPSCLTRMLGPLPGSTEEPMAEAMFSVLDAAGCDVVLPPRLSGLCCGMPFSSKAFHDAAEEASRRTADALWEASEGGRHPVVTDASACAGTLADLVVARLAAAGRALTVRDFPTFWARDVLPALPAAPRRAGTAVLHPPCTLVKQGALDDLLAVARAHAEAVYLPAGAECCGFAGDRGFVVPELTRAATAREAEEVRALGADGAGFFSTTRTCEIGMSRAVGRPYRSLVHLVREALRRA